MLEIEQALAIVLDNVKPLAPRRVAVSDCLDCVLAESVASDVDSPPHDKSVVDGFAVASAGIASPGAKLQVIEEVTAGAVPRHAVEPGAATRIMTGAPLPAGADAVVMVEQTETAGDWVKIHQWPVKAGQNIMRRAASMTRGQVVLEAGKLLRPIEVGLLAEVGRTEVDVTGQPRIAVLATGNELVSASAVPAAGQIRNSNGLMLAALARSMNCDAIDLGIARDDEDHLRRAMTAGLTHDVLLISGGVSAGVLDLVPRVLGQLGVEQCFHKVNLKPGKPLWFGRHLAEGGHNTIVFGLPGNPVSTLVCFELFVRPAIQRLCGMAPRGLPQARARLTHDHRQRGDRPTHWPAIFERGVEADMVTPLAWQGSGDLCALSRANCLAFFPGGERVFQAGEEIEVRLF